MASPKGFLRHARTWPGRLAARWRGEGGSVEARRQTALLGLGQLALEGAESKELLAHATALVARILDVPFSAVFAWEPDDKRLRVVAGVGWRSGVVGRATLDGAASPHVWRATDPVVFDLRAGEPALADAALLQGHEIASGLGVALTPRGRAYGMLAAFDGTRRRFSTGEVAFVRTAAKILAVALGREYGERALFEEMQMSTVLAHVGREIMSCTDVPVLLERVAFLTAQALHCDHSVVWLHHDDGGFRSAAAAGMPESASEILGSVPLSSETTRTLLADLAVQEIVRVESPSERHPLVGALLARAGVRVALVAPLHQGERIVGLLMSGHRDRAGDFRAHDQRVAHGIGQLASIALMNARVVEELERASQLKSEFVSTMSHELRTPLNIIIGYTDMVHDAPTRDEQVPLLAHVRKASHELLEMIDGTLNLNRLAAGGDLARFMPVVVAELWRELQQDFEAVPRRTEAALRWEVEGDVGLETDRRKLKIVLKNLVGNALKFTPTGEIVARACVVGEQCRFTVRDTGVGIPADALPHVFDMFRQADGSETRSYGGAGLGLYIVKSLLTQLGGAVQVRSTVGQGTEFTVTLPVVPVGTLPGEAWPAEAGATAASQCTHPIKQRLLFADDLPLNRLLMERFISREFPDVELVEACDGEQAVAAFSAERPDLVLLDLHMPRLDGWQAARAIRQLDGGREIAILSLSVDASPLAETNAVRAGFKEFIAKPISDYSALKARLKHWLAVRAAQQAPKPRGECEKCRREAGRAA
jgi:signal transduction histidine kinase/ActR/RegA family two-component response regulator